MIDLALTFLKTQVKNALISVLTTDDPDNIIQVDNIFDSQGNVNFNGCRLILANIEEEKVYRSQGGNTNNINGQVFYSNNSIKLNLYILFIARFQLYTDSLKCISTIISFLQAKNSFNQEKYPEMGEVLDKITVELFSPSFEQQNQLWANLGAKYLPSVLYKIRMLALNGDQINYAIPVISNVKVING